MNDAETYDTWKRETELSGRTPEELIAHYRAIGMTEYADRLAAVIQRMKGSAAKLC